MREGRYGPTDIQETFDDAVKMAIGDQERAGVDVITDGEMRRWMFVQGFYKFFQGLEPEEPLRKMGVYGYDSPVRYHPVAPVTAPDGLGIVEEYRFLKTQTEHPVKVTCPGPLTIGIHIRLKEARFYKDRLELSYALAQIVNGELQRVVAEGADFIQIDEPSPAIHPDSPAQFAELFNAAVEGVNTRLAAHLCFGNYAGRPLAKRVYAPVFDQMMQFRVDQLVLEFANRELAELPLCREIAAHKELALGLVDVKSYYIETPEDVAERIRRALEFVPAEKLTIVPDCGFSQTARWAACAKLQAMVAGTRIVRAELGADRA
jgi:5-methyltetrahydropteroyltriglutamate--homocysteine methyltransferase